MKNKKLCKFSALVLAAAMVLAMIPVSAFAGFSGWFSAWTDAEEVSVETQATTVSQPFVSGETVGSQKFRIPAIVTLNSGTIVAAADARWNGGDDGDGIDTLVAVSTDNGATWSHNWAAYLGYNDETKQTDTKAKNGLYGTFIDPELATDGETVWMLVDLFPRGNSNNNTGLTGNAFVNGHMRLSKGKVGNEEDSYTYYLGDFNYTDYAQIFDATGNTVDGYTVDRWFNLYYNGVAAGNLFYDSAAYQAYPINYLYLIKSTDEGNTWSAPTLIDVKEDGEIFYGTCTGSGRVLEVNGEKTIIFPCYGCKEIGTDLRASYIYSTDGGETWTRSWGRDDTTKFENYSSEATITEVKVGDDTYWYAFTRYLKNTGTSWAPIYTGSYYVSDDEGQTWEAKSDIKYSGGDAIGLITYSKLIDGKPAILLSASGSSSATYRKNGQIYTILVNDDGSLELYNTEPVTGTTEYFRYSDLTELNDGTVALLYESENGEITFKVYSPEELFGNGKITVEDEKNDSGITVAAPGLTSVTVETVKVAEDAIDGVEKAVAYNITPNTANGKYTGAATLKIKVPGEWDESRVYYFTQGDDGVYSSLKKATIEGGYAVIDATHFSVYGLALLSEGTVIEEEEPEYQEEITLTVNETKTVTISDYNYANYVNEDDLDTSIATVDVEGVNESKTDPTYDDISCKYNQLLNSNTNTKTDTGYYYLKDGKYYPLYVTRSSYGDKWKTYYYYYYYYDATTGVYTDIKKDNYTSYWSTTNTNQPFNGFTIYDKTSDGTDIPASTTITFHAVSAGTTSVIVGNTRYNITVKKATKNITLTIDGTQTIANAGTQITLQPDTRVATATIASGNLTIQGVAVGSTTVETDKYIVNVTVTDAPADGTHKLVSAEDVSYTDSNQKSYNSIITGDEVTGLLLSYSDSKYTYGTTSFVLKSGSNEEIGSVKVKDGKAASAVLNNDGTVTVTGAAVGTCVLEVTFSDNSITEIPVRVVKGAESNNYKLEQVYYFDAMYHSEVYYAAGAGNDDVDTTWTRVYEGYAFCVQMYAGSGNNKRGSVILLAAKPDDGYAVSTVTHSIKYSSNSWSYADGAYNFIGSSNDENLRFGSGFSFAADGKVSSENNIEYDDAGTYYFDYCYLKGGVVNKNDTEDTSYAYSMANFEALMNNAADENLNVGFMYSVSTALRLQVISDKLPTMEKTIKSINNEPYSEGMKIELGDKITYTLTFTSYHTHKSTFSGNKNNPTISYSNVKYTDELTGDIEKSLSAGLTTSTITNDGYTFENHPEELPMAETKTVDVIFTLSMDNFDKVVDGKLENVASATYEYTAFQSKGAAAAAAKAEAVSCKITTPTYIVDFGLPVELDLSSDLGGATIDGINSANLADFKYSGSTLTYTASKPLSAEEYVGLTLKKSTDGATVNQHYGVTIIPASNVLYEEDFLTPPAEDSSKPNWTHDGTTPTATQTAETVNAANPTAYGYDPAYASSTKDNGVYKADNLDSSTMTAALTTTFTGTGFDLIGNCGADTGSVMLFLKEKTTNARKVAIIDTRYTGGTLNQVPLAHLMVDEGTYEVKIFASGLDGTTTNANSAVSTYSMNHTSIASTTAFERYLKENNITDVEYIVMNDVLTASTQSVSAVSNYAVTADTPALQEGKHVEIDAFRVYYPTNNESYNAAEKNVQYMNILDVADSEQVNWWLENGTYTGEIAGYEAAGGPQNEIYLTGTSDSAQSGQAVTFQITGADSIQVSLRSVDGKQVIAGGHTIESSSEMYYTIQRTDNDGTFTIVNTGTGILGIGNVKIPGGTNEASILTASELDPEVVSYSIRMALAVEPDQTVEDESEQPVTFVPEKINVSSRSVNVLGRKLVTVSVTASTDVAYIAVNGQKVNAWNNGLSWIYQPSTLRFTFTDLLKRGESKTYEIVAYNADGVASAVYTVQG